LQVQLHFGCCEELGVKRFSEESWCAQIPAAVHSENSVTFAVIFPRKSLFLEYCESDQECCTVGTMYKDISRHDVSIVNGPCVYG